MSEYIVDYLKAVEALEEGRCEEIEAEEGVKYALSNSGMVTCTEDFMSGGIGITLRPSAFLGKWKLIGVKPEKKKIVMENILWQQSSTIVYPIIFPKGEVKFDWEKFLDKPHMKMTLEWEE